MRAILIGILWSLGASLAVAAPAGRSENWIGTWGAAPQPPDLVATARRGPSARYADQTIRQVVRVSAGGDRIRVRLTNEYGAAPLRIGAARVALPGPDGGVLPGSDRVLTFGGRAAATIPVGAPLVSDPVDLKLAPLSSLSISLYLPGETGPCTCHAVGSATGFVSGPGDFTAATVFPTRSTTLARAFVSRVEVVADQPASTVVVLGDSLSDGTASTPDANRRWPDRLAERLQAQGGGGRAWGVVNAAISGNRLLANGTGENGLARLDRDVLAVPGVSHLVVLLGINDLGAANGVPGSDTAGLTPADMIGGYRQLIARARARGLKVYAATLTPFQGAAYWSERGEADRQTLNAWIRTSGDFDGIVDFDAAWRDPAEPTRIKDGLAAPDHLHGSDEGYTALGDAVDLSLFR